MLTLQQEYGLRDFEERVLRNLWK